MKSKDRDSLAREKRQAQVEASKSGLGPDRLFARRGGSRWEAAVISLRDKVFGAYLGAAIGDALGGPVQAMHAERIRRLFGGVKDLLPYRKPPGFFDLGPGYALRAEPGSVTDETFVRAQFARFVVQHEHSRQLGEMVRFLVRQGDLEKWPRRMVEPLLRMGSSQANPTAVQAAVEPGGGVGWWTPFGIVNHGRPAKAATEVVRLSAIWKRPLEQDLLAAVQAGLAHALTAKATVDSVVEAACQQVGPLARALIERAVAIARSVPRGDVGTLIDQLYMGVLVDSAPDEIDAELPPPAVPPVNVDQPTGSALLAEQVPLAFAALVFGDGRSRLTLTTAASIGRDAKSIATTVGSWIGALVGRSRLPREWVGAVIAANAEDVDLVQQANDLADMVEPRTNL